MLFSTLDRLLTEIYNKFLGAHLRQHTEIIAALNNVYKEIAFMTATIEELKVHLSKVADTQTKLVGLVQIAVEGNATQTTMIENLKKQLADAVSNNNPPDVTDVIAQLDAISAQGDAMVAALTPPVTTPSVASVVTDPTAVSNPAPVPPDAPTDGNGFIIPPPVTVEAGVMANPANMPADPNKIV